LKSNNSTGTTGISYHKDRFGKIVYTVAYYSDNNKVIRKFFSHKKLGKELADEMAISWRDSNLT
jgi:hypothetical protein